MISVGNSVIRSSSGCLGLSIFGLSISGVESLNTSCVSIITVLYYIYWVKV